RAARGCGSPLRRVEPRPAALAYTDFLVATSAIGGLGQTCAAMTPCMRLYAYIGQSLAESAPTEIYAEWINPYADPEFDSLAATVEHLLDAYSSDVDRERIIYRRAMRMELDFFEAAFRGRTG